MTITQQSVADEMHDFLQSVPMSADLEWTKDRSFLFCFEAERLLAMKRGLNNAGLDESSAFKVLDFGYLHGLVPEFIHRFFPKAQFTICDRPDSPIFTDTKYLEVISKRNYLRLLPLDLGNIETIKETFTVILLGEIIEHLDPTFVASVIVKLRRIAEPNAVLLITTPNGAGLYNSIIPMLGHIVVRPPIPDAQHGYGHIHLWTPEAVRETLRYGGWDQEAIYFNHGREGELFARSRRNWGSLKHQVFIKGVQLIASAKPSLRGFFVMTARPADHRK